MIYEQTTLNEVERYIKTSFRKDCFVESHSLITHHPLGSFVSTVALMIKNRNHYYDYNCHIKNVQPLPDNYIFKLIFSRDNPNQQLRLFHNKSYDIEPQVIELFNKHFVEHITDEERERFIKTHLPYNSVDIIYAPTHSIFKNELII